MTYVVDTHGLIFFFAEKERLGEKALALFRDPKAKLIVPSIVLAEIKHLAYKKKLELLSRKYWMKYLTTIDA